MCFIDVCVCVRCGAVRPGSPQERSCVFLFFFLSATCVRARACVCAVYGGVHNRTTTGRLRVDYHCRHSSSSRPREASNSETATRDTAWSKSSGSNSFAVAGGRTANFRRECAKTERKTANKTTVVVVGGGVMEPQQQQQQQPQHQPQQQQHQPQQQQQPSSQSQPQQQQFCLRWNNHQNTLISVFDTLLESGSLTDCALAAEGQCLNAHKVVLSACSPYFAVSKKSRAPSPLVLWRRFDTRAAGRPRCRPAAAATRVPYVCLFARTQARGTPVERTPKSERALRTRVSRQLFFLSRVFLPLFTLLFLLLLFTVAYPYLIAAAVRQHAFSADNYSAYPARSSGISLPVDTAAVAAFRADIRPTTATDFRFRNYSIYLTYISLRTPRVAARTRGDFVSTDVRSAPPPAIEFYCSFLLAINLCMCGNFFLYDHFRSELG